MTTRTFPDIRPTSMSWDLVSNTRQYVSPFTGAIQTEARGGQRWYVTMQFENITSGDRATLQGFIAQVLGLSDNFTLYDRSYVRQGTGAVGTPLTVGAVTAGANSLDFDGVGAGLIDWLVPGDQFSVGGELKMVTTAVDTDSSGGGTINFVPEMHSGVADNTAITLVNPTGIFRFAQPRIGWSTRAPIISSFSIECVEDVLA